MHQIPTVITAELRQRLPAWVEDIRYSEEVDSEGDSALLVFLILAPAAELPPRDQRRVARETVHEVFAKHLGASWWPYVRFADRDEPETWD